MVLIVGPTAVGKTDLCIDLSQKFKADIFSCDSRQFYREMSIGTAKPSKEELAAATHHFINNRSISEDYSVADYEKEVLIELDEYYKSNDIAILTGGSGLFAKAITHGFDEIPDIPKEIRQELIELQQSKGLSVLVEKLEKVDPHYAQTADLHNAQRIIRALEVAIYTGKAFSEWHKSKENERPFSFIKIALERPREELYSRINKRVDLMLEAGLIEEVKSLEKYRDKNALQTVGYKEVFQFLDGKLSYPEMTELIKRNTRRYAKRQLTWFRNQDNFTWIQATNFKQIEEEIKKSLKK